MAMPTIDEVRALVHKGHGTRFGSPEWPLNRLWQEHLDARKEKYGTEFVSSAPKALTVENTSIVSEQWPLDDLSNLIVKDRTRPLRGDENAPVVMVRYQGRDCLVDGGRRITKWRHAKPPTGHEIWILEVIT